MPRARPRLAAKQLLVRLGAAGYQTLLRALQLSLIEFADRPEQTASHQVQIARVADRLVVVAQGRGEHLRLALVDVGPGNHAVARAFLAILAPNRLLAAGQGMGGVEDLA